MVLTVEEILNGVDEYKEVPIESLDDTMYLRPLSKGEWEKTNSIRNEALGDYVTNEKGRATSRNQRIADIESKLKFNIKENGDAEFRARVEAIHMSLNNKGNEKPPSKENIKKLRPDIFDEIYEKVMEISGVTNTAIQNLEDDVDEFPEN